jgi:hypothetical protein
MVCSIRNKRIPVLGIMHIHIYTSKFPGISQFEKQYCVFCNGTYLPEMHEVAVHGAAGL